MRIVHEKQRASSRRTVTDSTSPRAGHTSTPGKLPAVTIRTAKWRTLLIQGWLQRTHAFIGALTRRCMASENRDQAGADAGGIPEAGAELGVRRARRISDEVTEHDVFHLSLQLQCASQVGVEADRGAAQVLDRVRRVLAQVAVHRDDLMLLADWHVGRDIPA